MTEPSSRLKLAAGNLVPREGIGSEGSVPDEAKSNTKTADNEVDNVAEAEEATTDKAKVSRTWRLWRRFRGTGERDPVYTEGWKQVSKFGQGPGPRFSS